jgi:hypothetical protein
MVKQLLKWTAGIGIVLSVATQAGAYEKTVYEQNCVPCHRVLPTSLEDMFKSYLLIYSSEKFVKAGLKHYLKNPSRSISVMSTLFTDTYGIKKKTLLSPEALDRAIDIYWEKFKVFDTLK